MKVRVWCVPKDEGARFAHEILRADYYDSPQQCGGPVPISYVDGSIAILYTRKLPALPNMDGDPSRERYLPWMFQGDPGNVKVHVVVEPEFSEDYNGGTRLPEVDNECIVEDLQMERDYLALYEGEFGRIDPSVRKGLSYGAYVAKRSGESIISTQISLMRRQALGATVTPQEIGNVARVFDLLASKDAKLTREERLRILFREVSLFVKVYGDASILLRFVRDFLAGALDYMNDTDAYIRGPRGLQYANLLRLSPAFLLEAMKLIDAESMEGDVRILLLADYLLRGLDEH